MSKPRILSDALKNLKPHDPESYKDVGKIDYHKSVDTVVEKMIQKREAATGVQVNAVEKKSTVNLSGFVDDRPDRKFFKIGVK